MTKGYAQAHVALGFARLITKCAGMLAANQQAIAEGEVMIYKESWFVDSKHLLEDCGVDFKSLLDLLDPTHDDY